MEENGKAKQSKKKEGNILVTAVVKKLPNEKGNSTVLSLQIESGHSKLFLNDSCVTLTSLAQKPIASTETFGCFRKL